MRSFELTLICRNWRICVISSGKLCIWFPSKYKSSMAWHLQISLRNLFNRFRFKWRLRKLGKCLIDLGKSVNWFETPIKDVRLMRDPISSGNDWIWLWLKSKRLKDDKFPILLGKNRSWLWLKSNTWSWEKPPISSGNLFEKYYSTMPTKINHPRYI